MRHFRNDGLANRSFNHSGNSPMAEGGGVEPHPISENLVFKASRRTIPAASPTIYLVHPRGIEPRSTVLQTAAMTTSAKGAWGV